MLQNYVEIYRYGVMTQTLLAQKKSAVNEAWTKATQRKRQEKQMLGAQEI